MFYFNWRRMQEDEAYPRYETIIEDFKKTLSVFEKFLEEEGLGSVNPERCELTYINHISKGSCREAMNWHGGLKILNHATGNDVINRGIGLLRLTTGDSLRSYFPGGPVRSLLQINLILLVSLYLTSAHSQINDFNLPDFGDPSAAVISPIEEQKLGKM